MAFINERISPEDAVKYRVEEINSLVIGRNFSTDQWTVDRERNMYLRKVGEQVEDDHCPTGLSGWVFFWEGYLFWAEIQFLDCSGDPGEPGWGKKRLEKLGLMGDHQRHMGFYRPVFPQDLAAKKEDVIKDIYDALLAYKDGGVHASATSYMLELEVSEEV